MVAVPTLITAEVLMPTSIAGSVTVARFGRKYYYRFIR